MQVSEQCDRCGKVCTQTVKHGDTVHSRLRAFWGICRLFAVPEDSTIRKTQSPDLRGALLRENAFQIVSSSSRICEECANDYRRQHVEFAVEWYRSKGTDQVDGGERAQDH